MKWKKIIIFESFCVVVILNLHWMFFLQLDLYPTIIVVEITFPLLFALCLLNDQPPSKIRHLNDKIIILMTVI